MFKKVLVLCLALSLVIGVLTGCGQQQQSSAPAEKTLKVGLVTDVGGINDESFNASAYRGVMQAKQDLGVETGVVESKQQEDYETNLSSFASQGYDLVWAIGYLMHDATDKVAQQFPNVKFGIIDSVVDQPNVASVTFKEQEGSFLMGVIAASTTKTGKIGFVGGMESDLIKKFEAGYIAGARAVNPNIKILSSYTGKFDDPNLGYEHAMNQFNQGADIVYHASGYCGVGVIKAATEKGDGYYAIGVDSDQARVGLTDEQKKDKNAYNPRVLSSMVKRVDVGVFTVTKALKDGKFAAKHYELGLKEGGVGYSDTSKKTVDPKVLAKVDELKQQIIDGKIIVPTTVDEAKKFVLPQ